MKCILILIFLNMASLLSFGLPKLESSAQERPQRKEGVLNLLFWSKNICLNPQVSNGVKSNSVFLFDRLICDLSHDNLLPLPPILESNSFLKYLVYPSNIKSIGNLNNFEHDHSLIGFHLDCKNIGWVTWSQKTNYEYSGNFSSEKVSLKMDTLTGLQNPILNSFTLASNIYTPKMVPRMPTPWMPGKVNTTVLKHRVLLDKVTKPEDVILLLGSFPNSNAFTNEKPGRLKVFDINNVQLNVSNVVTILQDPIQGNILAPTQLTNTGSEILFEVFQPGTNHGDIILLNNFPKNSFYFEIEHYNEFSRTDDGIFINIGFPDCCIPKISRIDTIACDKFVLKGNVFTNSGSYSDTIKVNNCDSIVEYAIRILNKPFLSLGPDTIICEGASILLTSSSNQSFWSNGSVGNSMLVSKPGIYWAEVANSCGVYRDSIVIGQVNKILLDLGPDFQICPKEVDTIWTNEATTVWQDGSIGPFYVVSTEGLITALVKNQCGIVMDSLFVTVHPDLKLILPQDTLICGGRSIILNSPYDSTIWSDGTIGKEVVITKSGKYSASYATVCGLISDSIQVGEIACNDSCRVKCNNIEWMKWEMKSIYEFIGNSSRGSITLEADIKMGTTHPFFSNYQILTPGFSPNLLTAIPTPWMPGNLNTTRLSHKMILDGISERKDMVILLGEFPNSNLYSKPQFGKLRIYDQANNLLDLSNLCILLKDFSPPHDEVNVVFGDRELLFHVKGLGLGDGGILILQNIPDSAYVISIEHFNERSSIDDGIFINIGFIDCCNGAINRIDTAVCENITINGRKITLSGSYYDTIRIGNCDSVVNYLVSILNKPILSLGSDTIICLGETLTLKSNDSTTIWSDGTTGKELFVDKPGKYWAEINTLCDTVRDTILVSIFPNLNLDLGPDISLCPNESDTIWTYEPSTIWQDGSVGPYFVIKKNGLVKANIKSLCGELSDSIIVNYYLNPNIDLGPDTLICQGSIITLNSNSDSTLWFDNLRGRSRSVTKGGIYWGIIATPCGTVADSIEITEIPVYEKPNLPEDTFLCQGIELILFLPDIDELWNDKYLNKIEINSPGIYWYSFSDLCNDFHDTIQVYYDSIPIGFPAENLIFCGPKTFYFSTGNPRTEWSDGSVGASIDIHSTGNYYYMISNACGVFVDSIRLEFIEDNSFFVPNVFSPNGDQVNDLFPGIQFTNDFEMEVYDRWGSLIFKSKNVQWNGTSMEKEVLPGVYAYIIRSKACENKIKFGTVTLLR
ncbi:MAG: gliding motility-associated C-terminal domain-containing protein [Saprospiraceae bacterium]|nr:gliding motility-associated C-terminal domain-containing protein [Candidatus Vicinibacter affinis]